MKKSLKKILLIILSVITAGALVTACAGKQSAKDVGPDYSFDYYEPLHAEYDPFMDIDGKLDEEIWQGQKYLYWSGKYEARATTVFTEKGLYVGMRADDKSVKWNARYALRENGGFQIQVVKSNEYNYNDNVNYVHPSQHFTFNIDAKNSLCRSERRFAASGYCDGELNGETNYISAELFLPWSEMGYKPEELNENGMPDSVKVFIEYVGMAHGYAGFCDYNQFETYYTFDEHGSTCPLDRFSESDTVGYSLGGWTPGDKWAIDQENKVAENTVTRTQMLWFRKDVNGNAVTTATDYIANVKVKAIYERGPHVGIITLNNKTTFNIYGVETDGLQKSTVKVSSGQKTNGMRSVWDKHFSTTYSTTYAGGSYGDMTLTKDEVYLTVAKRGAELYYFVNGDLVGKEYDERVADECVVGIFANGRTVVSDWSFENFSGRRNELDEFLNKYIWFVTTFDDGAGYVVTDKTTVNHGDKLKITLTPKLGYVLSSFEINGEDKLQFFLNNADENATLTIEPESNLSISASFERLPRDGMKNVIIELYDAENNAVKPAGASFTIRGNDKRSVYTGVANNKGNVVASLLKAGEYVVNGKTIISDGSYTVEVVSKGYVTTKLAFTLPSDFNEKELTVKLNMPPYPYGSVTVNGVTVTSKGSGIYTYENKDDNEYYSDSSFIGFNTQYLKNAVFDGNYVFKAEVSLTEDAAIANGRRGSIVGYALSSGNRYIEFKTAAWIADKLYLNLNSSCEIGLSGFPVTSESGNSGFEKTGARKNFTIARYNDVIYGINNQGALCFTLSKNGLELHNSVIVEGGARLETFNQGVKSLFKDGSQNAFALYNLRSNEGGGAYKFKYEFDKSPKDLSGVLKTATAQLKDGESYEMQAEGTMINGAFICGSPVKIKFTGVPAEYNYFVNAEYENGDTARFLGVYDKANAEYEATIYLENNAIISLEYYGLGESTVNGQELTAPRGDVLDKTENGTYRSRYEQTEDIIQYYPDMKATGDFTLNAEITVVGDTAPERIDAGRVGSGVGIIISSGTDKELVVFSNKVQQDKLIFLVNTTRGGVMLNVNGFPNVNNHLGVLGSGIKFTVMKNGDELSFYNKNGVKILTFNKNGETTTASGVIIEGTDEKKTTLSAHLSEMLKAGEETAFGIYREFNFKGEYEWKVNFGAQANGENLSATAGSELIKKTADGTYRNEYAQTGDVIYYVPELKTTGDFTLDAQVTVVGNTAPERIDAGNVGSGVGVIIACGKDKEIVIFCNKVNQDKLIIRVNTPRGGTLIYLTGFKNVNNHLGVLGAGIKFTVKRADNKLEIYDKNGNKGVTIDENGNVIAESGFGISGDSATVGAHVANMLKNGEETTPGIYREFNYKGEYEWQVSITE